MKSLLLSLTNRRMAILMVFGFSTGLPLALITGTLQAWMTDEKVDLQTLGNFSLVTLPYALKFLWAPLLDRYLPPILGAYGRRLGWALASQAALMVLIALLAMIHPAEQMSLLFLLSLAVAFSSATQDIVVDAYRADLLPRSELGPGVSVAIFGYRMGLLTSGAIALSLAQVLPWQTVYCSMAILQGVGVVAAFLAPRLPDANIRPRTLQDAVVLPFLEYLKRRGAIELLIFILLYKLSDVIAGMFTTKFMLDTGFAKAEIAAVVKGFGLVATIAGSLIGGLSLTRLGMKQGLIWFGILQGATNLSFAVLAAVGKDYMVMATAITLENFCGGLATAAFTAFLTGLCHHRFTATQYALLTSLAAVSRSLMGAPCGYLATQVDWVAYFVISTAAALPALVMIWLRYDTWKVGVSEESNNAVI